MPDENITLEILVRGGNVNAVTAFAKEHKLTEKHRKEKIAEAALYHLAGKIRKDWSTIGVDGIPEWLQQPDLKKYFETTENTDLIWEIVSSLEKATRSVDEDSPYLLAISVLGVPALAKAFKRITANVPAIKNTLNDLITECYQVVFSASASNMYFIEHYLPLLKPWEDCADTVNLVPTVLGRFADDENLLEYDYKKEFFYAAIDALIQITGRRDVSERVRDIFGQNEDNEVYQQLLADKKIDPVEQKQKTKPSKITKALDDFEKDWPNKYAVEQLAKQLQGKGQERVAQRIVLLFLFEKFDHLTAVVTYGKTLYDATTVKQRLTEKIIEVIADRDYTKLAFALQLPEELIDRNKPELEPFIRAYDLRKTKIE